jgi:hypothetical protein
MLPFGGARRLRAAFEIPVVLVRTVHDVARDTHVRRAPTVGRHLGREEVGENRVRLQYLAGSLENKSSSSSPNRWRDSLAS